MNRTVFIRTITNPKDGYDLSSTDVKNNKGPY